MESPRFGLERGDKSLRGSIPIHCVTEGGFSRGGMGKQTDTCLGTGGLIQKAQGLSNAGQVARKRKGTMLEYAFLPASLC